jgi:hypothetical protein
MHGRQPVDQQREIKYGTPIPSAQWLARRGLLLRKKMLYWRDGS